jgi:hypothetical protein
MQFPGWACDETTAHFLAANNADGDVVSDMHVRKNI